MTPPAKTALSPAQGLILRAAEARGKADHGWLRSAHSFSFADYIDPDHMHFENLRVINDDYVAAGAGFPMHAHADAEIFSYVLDGKLEHKDSLGHGSTVAAGGVQYMSAGSGVRHSEFNPSNTKAVKFLQIWLIPSSRGGTPRYETMDITPEDKNGRLKLFLSPNGRDESMRIKADADIYAATLNGTQTIKTRITDGRRAWVQVARGSVTVNGENLRRGDGLAITQPGEILFSDGEDAEFIFFDLKALN